MVTKKEPIGYKFPDVTLNKLLDINLVGLLSRSNLNITPDHVTFYVSDKEEGADGEYVTVGYLTTKDRENKSLSITGATPGVVKKIAEIVEKMEEDGDDVAEK